MTKYYYADVMPDGLVRACFEYEAPDVGPPTEGAPNPGFEDKTEGTLINIAAPIVWEGPTPTSVLYMLDETLTWVETASIDELKAAKLAELAVAFSKGMEAVKAGYPEEEVLSWSKQEAEAVAFAASPAVAVPLLSGIAGARGISVDDLASRVLAKAQAWAVLSGAMIGKRQACEDAVNAATTIEEVRAIAWE